MRIVCDFYYSTHFLNAHRRPTHSRVHPIHTTLSTSQKRSKNSRIHTRQEQGPPLFKHKHQNSLVEFHTFIMINTLRQSYLVLRGHGHGDCSIIAALINHDQRGARSPIAPRSVKLRGMMESPLSAGLCADVRIRISPFCVHVASSWQSGMARVSRQGRHARFYDNRLAKTPLIREDVRAGTCEILPPLTHIRFLREKCSLSRWMKRGIPCFFLPEMFLQ